MKLGLALNMFLLWGILDMVSCPLKQIHKDKIKSRKKPYGLQISPLPHSNNTINNIIGTEESP